MNYRWFVGIDISKGTLDICVLCPANQTESTFKVSNDAKGHTRLVNKLIGWGLVRQQSIICLEHTGIYGSRLLDYLSLDDWTVAVEKTTLLKKVRPEHHRKEDQFDSRLIAEYAHRFSDRLRLYHSCDPLIEQLRALYHERRKLITRRAGIDQQIGEVGYHTHDTTELLKSWKRHRTWLQREVVRIETQITRLRQSHCEINRRFEQIKAIDGFGEQMALLWVLLHFGQDQLNHREIASRFGFAPHASSSGSSRNRPAKSSGHGKSEVRRMMYLCAQSACTHHPKYKAYKEKKLAEGKKPVLIHNNVINKLIKVACAVWNQDEIYDRNHVSCFAKAA